MRCGVDSPQSTLSLWYWTTSSDTSAYNRVPALCFICLYIMKLSQSAGTLQHKNYNHSKNERIS